MTTLWVDAQLPPAIAAWITDNHEVTAVAVRDIGVRDATDQEIFAAARAAAQAETVIVVRGEISDGRAY